MLVLGFWMVCESLWLFLSCFGVGMLGFLVGIGLGFVGVAAVKLFNSDKNLPLEGGA